jgi:ABC-type transport system involved in Fe-S cluster assembly fused permease/ATPase subunit
MARCLQDTVLFNDTIFYNIAYGRPTATREEVLEAARLARIDDAIRQMPVLLPSLYLFIIVNLLFISHYYYYYNYVLYIIIQLLALFMY